MFLCIGLEWVESEKPLFRSICLNWVNIVKRWFYALGEMQWKLLSYFSRKWAGLSCIGCSLQFLILLGSVSIICLHPFSYKCCISSLVCMPFGFFHGAQLPNLPANPCCPSFPRLAHEITWNEHSGTEQLDFNHKRLETHAISRAGRPHTKFWSFFCEVR